MGRNRTAEEKGRAREVRPQNATKLEHIIDWLTVGYESDSGRLQPIDNSNGVFLSQGGVETIVALLKELQQKREVIAEMQKVMRKLEK